MRSVIDDSTGLFETQPAAALPLRQRRLLMRIAQHLEAYLDEGKHPLNSKQIAVIRDIIDSAHRGQWSGIIKRPMGTGKTVIFSAVVQALQGLSYELESESSLHREHGFLILMPTNFLAEQTYNTMVSKLRDDGSPMYGFDPDDVAILDSDSSDRIKGEGLLTRLHHRRVGQGFTIEQLKTWLSGEEVPPSDQLANFADAMNMSWQERLMVFRAAANSRSEIQPE